MKYVITYGTSSLLESKKVFLDGKKDADLWKMDICKLDPRVKIMKEDVIYNGKESY
jgi:hypothetical protein